MRIFSPIFFSILLVIFLCSCLGVVGSRPIDANPSSVPVSKTITVDGGGGGDFKTVQSAIDSIPADNNEWILVHVKAGTYREQVKIPMDKPFVVLEGEGSGKTTIVWNGYGNVAESATFTSSAENFVAKSIAFKNSYTAETGILNQADAVLVDGDKSSFYDCAFIGVEDTLFDCKGRHYFKSCYFEGYIDIIFGYGQSFYQNCVISTTQSGWITAQGRSDASDPGGFVFKDCVVQGKGKSYLGRAWKTHPRVLFLQTSMADVINPEGWDAWNQSRYEENFIFAEQGCTGPGADTSKRVSWEKKPTSAELAPYETLEFVNKEGWIEKQP